MRSFLAAVALVSAVCAAQELKQVSEDEALAHITKRFEPEYPSMAEIAHIQGDVEVQLSINESGRVTQATGVSGHPMLLDAAIHAVKGWRFEPFLENGKPIPVGTIVKLGFWLGPVAVWRRNYLQQEAACTRQIQSNRPSEAETACKKALSTALKLPRNFESDRMRAYGNAGMVAYALQKPEQALEDFKQQLSFAEKTLPPGNPQMIQVRANVAHAYTATGQLQEASAAYVATEHAQEAAESELESRRGQLTEEAYRRTKASYAHSMQVILLEHVAVLRKLGNIPEAQALEQKPSALTENSK
jgi:TonB family protein